MEINRADVDRRLRRLRDGSPGARVVEATKTVSEAQFEELRADARDGYVGAAYARVLRGSAATATDAVTAADSPGETVDTGVGGGAGETGGDGGAGEAGEVGGAGEAGGRRAGGGVGNEAGIESGEDTGTVTDGGVGVGDADRESPRVLLVMENGSHVWSLPGGRRSGSETFEEAAVRGVREDVGVDCDATGCLRIDRTIVASSGDTDDRIHLLYVVVDAVRRAGSIDADPEAIEGAVWTAERPARTTKLLRTHDEWFPANG